MQPGNPYLGTKWIIPKIVADLPKILSTLINAEVMLRKTRVMLRKMGVMLRKQGGYATQKLSSSITKNLIQCLQG